ncbi:hypothetical protein GCM10010261_10250 [Streptomyces pilosus]|nr:hypothetical protein GCM10010261_10250 [Streptomyces pilosus]
MYPSTVSREGQSLLKPSLYFMAVVAHTSAAMAPASSRYPMCTSVHNGGVSPYGNGERRRPPGGVAVRACGAGVRR